MDADLVDPQKDTVLSRSEAMQSCSKTTRNRNRPLRKLYNLVEDWDAPHITQCRVPYWFASSERYGVVRMSCVRQTAAVSTSLVMLSLRGVDEVDTDYMKASMERTCCVASMKFQDADLSITQWLVELCGILNRLLTMWMVFAVYKLLDGGLIKLVKSPLNVVRTVRGSGLES
jgi:hypothetical protein